MRADISKHQSDKSVLGFTMIEILLVIALIAILVGIVIFAINPSQQLADGRNVQRKNDVNAILNAIYQYALDNNGNFPAALRQTDYCDNSSQNELCQSDGQSCDGYTDLSELTNSEKYLVTIPFDPSINYGANNTGYFASYNSNHRVSVCAPNAELGVSIRVTR